MQTRPTFYRIAALALVAALHATPAAAQDVRSDRFGLGAVAVAGTFDNYSGAFVGGEGFVRLARGSFWSIRLDGAYAVSILAADKVNLVQPIGSPGYDTQTIGKIGTLMATAMLGPSSSNGLRPIYGLVGFGGAVTAGDQRGDRIGTGPSFALAQVGFGSEFHALLNERIEFRAFRPWPTSSPASPGTPLGVMGMSLTIGVVW